MFHAIVQTYADAMYVATTLRPPMSPTSACESERIAGSDARGEAGSSGPLAGQIVQWLRTRLGCRVGATAAPGAPIPLSRLRAPHS